MAEYIIVLLGGTTILAVSVTLRCRRLERISARQVEGVESPMSRAIQATVGYAGGIYMTLVMLASFLQVEVPDKVVVLSKLTVEPLAFVAVMLALLQPFLLVMWDWLMKKK